MIEIKPNKIDPSIKEALVGLGNLRLDFYVVGSLLVHPYLNDHSRYTKDIDIIFDEEIDVVRAKLEKVFGSIDFSFDEANDSFYEPSFTCFVNVGGKRAQIEGKRIKFFDQVKSETYSYEGITFKGVSIEYVISEKIVSLLNELARPYKHLVDLYSFSKIDQSLINKDEINKYINFINNQENEFRKKNGIKERTLPNQIPFNKQFIGEVIVPTLQSKYNVSKEEMISEVNKWLKGIIK